MTSNIVSKNVWNNINYKNKDWIHYEKLLNFPLNSHSYIFSKPMILLGREINRWNIEQGKIVSYTTILLNTIITSNISNETKINLVNIYKQSLFQNIIACKRKKMKYKSCLTAANDLLKINKFGFYKEITALIIPNLIIKIIPNLLIKIIDQN